MLNSVKQIYDNTMKLKLPPAKPEVYCLSASKTPAAHGLRESGYSPTAYNSNSDTYFHSESPFLQSRKKIHSDRRIGQSHLVKLPSGKFMQHSD